MENILYLDDYINFYHVKNKLLIVHKPYKHTLKYGKIIDHDKFIKKFTKIIGDNKLNKNFFNSSINVIINGTYNKEDKRIIKDVLENFNYQKINFIPEIKFLKLTKKAIIINANLDYTLIYYLDYKGNMQVITLDNNKFLNVFLKYILNQFKNKRIYLYGKNYLKIIDLLKECHQNYFYYEDSENLIINKIINDKFM